MKGNETLALARDVYYCGGKDITIFEICEFLHNNKLNEADFNNLTIWTLTEVFNYFDETTNKDVDKTFSAYKRLYSILEYYNVSLDSLIKFLYGSI